jgi:molybdenum cofactor synthesis domain-containing protein
VGSPSRPPQVAAALVVGNELLSGKVEEENLAPLAKLLRGLGVLFKRAVFVLDDMEVIAREVEELSRTHDWLFTSGGVGPTHDDVTVAGVAKAFGVPVVMAPEMEAMIRAHYRERCTENHLRMALVPLGAALEVTEEVRWHTIRMKNVWCLPGVPEVFRLKLAVVKERLGVVGPRFVSLAVHTKMDEGELKPLLDRVVAAFPDVDVGSYPKWHDPLYKTKITFDGRDEARVGSARASFVATLPAGEPQPIE